MLLITKMSNKTKNTVSKKESTSSSEVDSADDFFNDLLAEEMIHPGLILKDDYVLLIKIGYGNNAGVWMTYQLSTESYIAMKIQDYGCYDDGCREIKIIKKINEWSKNNKSVETNCIKMLDFFIFEVSDKLRFVCSTYELYAGSVHMLIKEGKYKYGLPINVVKNIGKQLVQSIVFLHNKVEIIHTDIKPENILFKGIPESHLKVMKIFDNSHFQSKYNKLEKKYELHPKKFIEERDNLALNCINELQFIEEKFENHINESESDSELESDGSIIEGEDEFEDSDGSDDDSNALEDLEEDSGEDEDDDDEDTSEEEQNTRRQSVPDFISFMQYKKTEDIEYLYDYESVLNNREKSTDKLCRIDDKYVTDCKITLTDFGNSYFYNKRTEHEIQDRLYRSPEVILDYKYSYAADIWSIGCVIFELLTGYPLFRIEIEPLNKDIHHLFLMEKILGPIPKPMKKKSKRTKFLFDHKRNLHIKNIENIKRTSIFDILVKQHLFSEKSARETEELLLAIFQYNPSKRINAVNLLNHPWFKITD